MELSPCSGRCKAVTDWLLQNTITHHTHGLLLYILHASHYDLWRWTIRGPIIWKVLRVTHDKETSCLALCSDCQGTDALIMRYCVWCEGMDTQTRALQYVLLISITCHPKASGHSTNFMTSRNKQAHCTQFYIRNSAQLQANCCRGCHTSTSKRNVDHLQLRISQTTLDDIVERKCMCPLCQSKVVKYKLTESVFRIATLC